MQLVWWRTFRFVGSYFYSGVAASAIVLDGVVAGRGMAAPCRLAPCTATTYSPPLPAVWEGYSVRTAGAWPSQQARNYLSIVNSGTLSITERSTIGPILRYVNDILRIGYFKPDSQISKYRWPAPPLLEFAFDLFSRFCWQFIPVPSLPTASWYLSVLLGGLVLMAAFVLEVFSGIIGLLRRVSATTCLSLPIRFCFFLISLHTSSCIKCVMFGDQFH